MATKEERYSLDDQGLLVEHVGPWAKDKLKIVTDYIAASGAARSKFIGTGAAYIDVFCGPGRSKIRDINEYIDGSPVAAFKKAKQSRAPFTSIQISDSDPKLLAAAEKRLTALEAPILTTKGPASVAMPKIVRNLNSHGLHFAFLDPHNLGTLSFDLFESLAKLKRIDIIVHVSLSDLQRNVDRYTTAEHNQFDKFSPGWRDHISLDQTQKALRQEILKYWTNKVMSLGLPRAKHCELIKGTGNQCLYWLMFLSKNSFAHRLWSKISSPAKSPQFDFGAH